MKANNDQPQWIFVIRRSDGQVILTRRGNLCWFGRGKSRAEAESLVKQAAASRAGVAVDDVTVSGCSPHNYAAMEADNGQYLRECPATGTLCSLCCEACRDDDCARTDAAALRSRRRPNVFRSDREYIAALERALCLALSCDRESLIAGFELGDEDDAAAIDLRFVILDGAGEAE